MAAKYVLEQAGNGMFIFTLRASNGQVILTSLGYADKESALKGINSLRRNAGKDNNYELLSEENGQSYFVLINARKEVIGQSEMYSESRSVAEGIALVKANARAARLEDLTGQE